MKLPPHVLQPDVHFYLYSSVLESPFAFSLERGLAGRFADANADGSEETILVQTNTCIQKAIDTSSQRVSKISVGTSPCRAWLVTK